MERDITFEQFSAKKRGAGTKNTHKHTVTGSWGVWDYYKHYNKIKPKKPEYVIDRSVFYKIIRKANLAMADLFFREKRLVLPMNFGTLEIISFKDVLEFRDGKLKTNRLVDWNETIKLWYSDPEAEKNKTLVRFDNTKHIRFHYRKGNAIYKNKTFYEFVVNRPAKRRYNEYEQSFGTGDPYFIDLDNISIKKLYDE